VCSNKGPGLLQRGDNHIILEGREFKGDCSPRGDDSEKVKIH
jgi:hypothetical protein